MTITKKFLYESVALVLLLAVIGSGITVYHQVKKIHTISEIDIENEQYGMRTLYITKYKDKTISGANARLLFYSIKENDGELLENNKLSIRRGASDEALTSVTNLGLDKTYQIKLEDSTGKITKVTFVEKQEE